MTAALYALRAGMSVIVIESDGFGGQITSSHLVENYPALPGISGNEFADRLLGQILSFDADLAFEKALSIEPTDGHFTVITEDDAYPCRSVILATGAKNRCLGVEGEQRLTGSGVSYCAVCDGAFHRADSVAVVGGGNTALQDALYLSDICWNVWLIHRRDSFRGEDRLVQALRQRDNVEFLLDAQVTELAGADALESVTVSFRDGSSRTLPTTGLFVAVGQVPDNSAFENLVELSEGYIVAENECFTKTPGIFTAGDCRVKGVRQLTTAVSDGAVAALAACEWLRSH